MLGSYYPWQNVMRKNRRTYMSMSDFWHSPSIDATLADLNNRPRVDVQDGASLEQGSPVVIEPSVRSIEGLAGSRSGDNNFQDQTTSGFAVVEHNSVIEAQEIARQTPAVKSDIGSKKGMAVVASASESVGTHDALARLDQNGDGRIDQVEVKKAIRADEATSTFAALSQYQKSPEVQQKFSSAEELDTTKLFNNDEVKVEKLFDDEQLEQDLYQDNYQEPQHQARPEVVVPDVAS
jgi:hypothetical protein